MAPKIRLRFRKSFPIIPKVLYFTASKKGVSMTLRIGPVNKTWGTAGETLSIDAPGTMGFSWRKDDRRSLSKRRASKRAEREAKGLAPHTHWNTVCIILFIETMALSWLLWGRTVGGACFLAHNPWKQVVGLLLAQGVAALLIAEKIHNRLLLAALLAGSGVVVYMLWLRIFIAC